jgi:hypothetical protein
LYSRSPALVRLDELLSFTRQTGTFRALAILLLTPLSCVVLLGTLPLRPPGDGVLHQSATYWTRLLSKTTVPATAVMLQIWHASLRLPLVKTHFVLAVMFVGTGETVIIYVFHLLIGFPTPFMLQTSSVTGSTMAHTQPKIRWKTPIREDPEVRRDLWQFLWICTSEFAMMLLYPVMIWVFGLLNGTQQTVFTMTFPMVKLILKNLASRGLYRLEDLAPVYAVLGVDTFHALLLSCAMQSSISSGTLICIMGTDIVQSVVAVGEARLIIRKFKQLVVVSEVY